MTRRELLRLVGSGAALAALAGCGGGGATPRARSRGGPDVIAVAQANGAARFARAIRAAELGELLSGPGPYTLFAPSDRAFAASDAARQGGEALQRTVAYHVVPGLLTSDFMDGADVNHTTLLGTSLNVDGAGGGLRVNGAGVIRRDVEASNGVVFVVDRVLGPR
jgi:uncharacterized surface protein with fasciclin (FAS1) repeats